MTWTLDALIVGDSAAAWAAAGFIPTDDEIIVGSIAVRCADDGGGADRWAIAGDHVPDDIDGIATTAVGERTRAMPAHPNGVVALDHVVVASPDLDRTTEAFEALGIECRRIRDASRGATAMQQRFFRLGDAIIELVGPPTPSGDGPATIWGHAFTTADLDGAKATLGDRLSDPKDAVQTGRRIATVRTRDLGITVPIVLMTPHPGHH